MKRTVIGSVLMITGTIIDLSIIIAASHYLLGMKEWGGLDLWSAIFGSQDLTMSLSLGVPFIIGLILFIIGLIILAQEYLNTDKK
jgi:hypothetical protein